MARYRVGMDLSPIQAVLLFVGVPGAFILLVALMTLAPSWTRVGSYRPGEPWPYEPLMIHASGDPEVYNAIEATPAAEFGVGSGRADTGVGGASARW